MSLVNAFITRERAVVAVDTEARLAGPNTDHLPRFQTSKMFTLPHANVLLAARGSHSFLMPIYFALSNMQASSFDQYARALRKSLLRETTDQSHAAVRAAGGPASFDIGGQELFMFGWSIDRSAMAGIVCFRDPGVHEWEVMDAGETWVDPWCDDWGDLPGPRSIERLEAVAREQVTKTRAEAPHVAIGGRLLVAELTRDSISIRSMANLG